MSALEPGQLDAAIQPEPSACIAERVLHAQQRQRARHGVLNARLSLEDIRHIDLEPEASRALAAAMGRFGFSARACHRVLRVARTCADLANARAVRRADVLEAVQLRPGGYFACETM